ncbi:hypothetical protein HGM15179_021541, partial [Zosterops borbonicus]
MCAAGRRWGRRQRALLWAVLLAAWEAAWGQLRYSVPEEMPKGSFVGDVAKDLGLHLPALGDRGVRVVSEVSDMASDIFRLDSETGEITLLRSLDYEEGDAYELDLQAYDGGTLYDTAKVGITVTDVNDNMPEISVMSAISEISEDAPSGTAVALLHVQDRDSGANGE